MSTPVLSETAMDDFDKRVHKNFIEGGFQLKAILGTRWKKNLKNAAKVRFNVGTEVTAKKKVGVGSLVTQSKGGKIKPVWAYPEEYEVTSIVGQIEMDETGIFVSEEFTRMHSNAMGVQVDKLIVELLRDATYRDKNNFGGGTLYPDPIDLTSYENSAAGKHDGLVTIATGVAGIGGARTKHFIIDTKAHALLLQNEKYINNDYSTKGAVESGNMHGRKILGTTVLLLDDLDEEYHTTNSLLELGGVADDELFIVTEDSIGVACHYDGQKTSITKEPLLKNDTLIYTEISFGAVVISNRAMFKVKYKTA